MFKLILAIETSCDETSLAILKSSKFNQSQISNSDSFLERINAWQVLSERVSTQIELHKPYGGVVPEIGARSHAENIFIIFQEIIQETSQKLNLTQAEILQNLTAIKVTTSPGLTSALKVGLEFAKSLQFFIHLFSKNKPKILKKNHLQGHLMSAFFKPASNILLKTQSNIFPHLHLLVSGGNTQLIFFKKPGQYQIIGQTLDDAVGETLDKAGRMLGLPYPGGIWIAKIAGLKFKNTQNFPIGMKNSKSLDFSYSGLKTAIRYFLQDLKLENWKYEQKLNLNELNILQNQINSNSNLAILREVIISIQTAALTQLFQKLKLANERYQPKTLGMSGGVSANLLLRQKIQENFNLPLFFPELKYTGDNAVMIGLIED